MRLVVDIETNGLYNEVDKIHCIVAKDINTSERYLYYLGVKEDHGEYIVEADRNKTITKSALCYTKPLSSMLQVLQEADQIIGHNFIDYDMRVIEKITGIKLDVNKIVDTLLLSHMLHPHHSRHPDCPASKETIAGRRQIGPHSLENWGYYLGEGKIEYEDWTKFTPEMLERCKGDVSITEKLYNKFKGE